MMDRREAEPIARAKVSPYRERSYAELVALIGQEPETGEVDGAGGVRYQFEIQVFWDGRKGGDVRVLGTICESPQQTVFCRIPILRWLPIYGGEIGVDFVLSPNGEFVGEE
jgi:hypothetical protein